VFTLGVTQDVSIPLVTHTEPVTTGEDVPTRGVIQDVNTPLDTHQESQQTLDRISLLVMLH
jgi:hypothetical protein